MKKKTITVLVVLVFIGIASFSLYPEYQSYMETKNNPILGIEDVKGEGEVEKIGNINLNADFGENQDNIISILKNNKYSFYKIEALGNDEIGTIYKSNKEDVEDFRSSVCDYYRNTDVIKKEMEEKLKQFLSISYQNAEKLPHGDSTLTNYYISTPKIDNYFGNSIYDYCIKHQITTQCMDAKISKVLVVNDKRKEQNQCIYFEVKAKIKTKTAVGDISKTPFLPAKGKTKVKTFYVCGYDADEKDAFGKHIPVTLYNIDFNDK